MTDTEESIVDSLRGSDVKEALSGSAKTGGSGGSSGGRSSTEEKSSKSSGSKKERTSKDEKKDVKEPVQEKIFLLEIILDKLTLSYCTEFMNRCHKGPNVISYSFLGQGPIIICENRPIMRECQEKRTGASCLFVMTRQKIEEVRKKFEVDFQVLRSTPQEDIVLGDASLDLTNVMRCVCAQDDAEEMRRAIELEEMKGKPPTMPKPAKNSFSEMLREKVILMAPADTNCGEAAILDCYVRLTCFGTLMQTPCRLVQPQMEDFPTYVNCSRSCTPRPPS